VSLVTSKLGADAGTVLAAMLAYSRKHEASLQVSWSVHILLYCGCMVGCGFWADTSMPLHGASMGAKIKQQE
jgi:hypothetical protein